MDSTFWLKLGLGFVLGGAWVTMSTISAERFGSKIGGLIGGLPSTVVLTLLFIGLTQSPQVAADATIIIPLSMSATGLFMVVFLFFARRGLAVGLSIAFLIWFALASLLVRLELRNAWLPILGWIILAVVFFLDVEKVMQIPSRIMGKVHYTPSQIAYRALFGGAVIAFAVLMGKIGGPLFGGVFSTFPAMFFSTLVITYRMGGADFSRAIGKSLLMSGMVTVPIYALAVGFLYPRVGMGIGTLFALLLAAGAAYLTYLFIRIRMS
jgi:hypothetical protein